MVKTRSVIPISLSATQVYSPFCSTPGLVMRSLLPPSSISTLSDDCTTYRYSSNSSERNLLSKNSFTYSTQSPAITTQSLAFEIPDFM